MPVVRSTKVVVQYFVHETNVRVSADEFAQYGETRVYAMTFCHENDRY
jgi:hypothetical protein